MPFLDAPLAALAEGREVALAVLVELNFVDGWGRYWLGGTGAIVIGGETYLGTGEMVGMSPITFGTDDTAEKVILRLSGVDSNIVAQVRDAPSVRGRDAWLWLQFMDPPTGAPIGSRVPLGPDYFMATIGYAAEGPASRTIELTLETIWTGRNAASNGTYTDRDQQARFPGDVGLIFVPKMRANRVTWPVYS